VRFGPFTGALSARRALPSGRVPLFATEHFIRREMDVFQAEVSLLFTSFQAVAFFNEYEIVRYKSNDF
jgi:hypothetical protein